MYLWILKGEMKSMNDDENSLNIKVNVVWLIPINCLLKIVVL